MNKNAIFVAAFCWAVTAVPLAASPERSASIPSRDSLSAVSAGTDGRELFDGSEARGTTSVPPPAAGADSRQAGSDRGFCNGSFREFDQKVGKVPVLRGLFSIILQPVVIYCTLTN
jgi:hypothetical protein